MAERVERNITVQLAVDATEQIQVEFGSDAFRIVISGDQPADLLYPVHSNQQLGTGAEGSTEMAKQVGCAPLYEISDCRAGKESQPRHAIDRRRKLDILGEIGLYRMNLNGR